MLLVGVSLLIGVLIVIGSLIGASGEIDYCYIKSERMYPNDSPPRDVHWVIGARPWRENTRVGPFSSVEEAVAASKQLPCGEGLKN